MVACFIIINTTINKVLGSENFEFLNDTSILKYVFFLFRFHLKKEAVPFLLKLWSIAIKNQRFTCITNQYSIQSKMHHI